LRHKFKAVKVKPFFNLFIVLPVLYLAPYFLLHNSLRYNIFLIIIVIMSKQCLGIVLYTHTHTHKPVCWNSVVILSTCRKWSLLYQARTVGFSDCRYQSVFVRLGRHLCLGRHCSLDLDFCDKMLSLFVITTFQEIPKVEARIVTKSWFRNSLLCYRNSVRAVNRNEVESRPSRRAFS
jgi:hypothetical protein